MKHWPLLVLASMPGSLYSQSSKSEEWTTVEKVCGRVADSEFPSTPWSSSEVLGMGRPKKADVLLYRRKGQEKCCAKEAPVAEVLTGSDGRFDFEDAVPGQYWVVVAVGKKKYKSAATLDPSSRKGYDCSDLIYQIRGEELRLLGMITVS